MSIFSKKQSIQGLIKELEEDKEKLEYLLVHVNLLKNAHKIAFNKTHIKEQRYLIMNQLKGLVHEMSEELKKINKNLPKKIDFDDEKMSKFNEDYDKLINDIKIENEIHKKILQEIKKEEKFEDKEKNLEIDLEKKLKIDNKIIEDLQQLNKTVDENLKFLKENKVEADKETIQKNKNYKNFELFSIFEFNKSKLERGIDKSIKKYKILIKILNQQIEINELINKFLKELNKLDHIKSNKESYYQINEILKKLKKYIEQQENNVNRKKRLINYEFEDLKNEKEIISEIFYLQEFKELSLEESSLLEEMVYKEKKIIEEIFLKTKKTYDLIEEELLILISLKNDISNLPVYGEKFKLFKKPLNPSTTHLNDQFIKYNPNINYQRENNENCINSLVLIKPKIKKLIKENKRIVKRFNQHDLEKIQEKFKDILKREKNKYKYIQIALHDMKALKDKFETHQIVAVHLTNYFPNDGLIKPTSSFLTDFEGQKIKFPRGTIHFALNSCVSGHAYGNWDKCKFAIIIPGELIWERFYSVNPQDSWIVGELKLPEGTEIVCKSIDLPKNANPGNAKIIEVPNQEKKKIKYPIERIVIRTAYQRMNTMGYTTLNSANWSWSQATKEGLHYLKKYMSADPKYWEEIGDSFFWTTYFMEACKILNKRKLDHCGTLSYEIEEQFQAWCSSLMIDYKKFKLKELQERYENFDESLNYFISNFIKPLKEEKEKSQFEIEKKEYQNLIEILEDLVNKLRERKKEVDDYLSNNK